MKTLASLLSIGTLTLLMLSCNTRDKNLDRKNVDTQEKNLAGKRNDTQDQPARKRIAPSMVAEYEKMGAVYGGFIEGSISVDFERGKEAAKTGVPGFEFPAESKENLPDPGIPFGLKFSVITDPGLMQLARLKNLTALSLSSTQVRRVALKELSGLTQLTILSLVDTQLINFDLKELAGLKNLTALGLSHNRTVTDEGLKELASLKELAVFGLSHTGVTDAGLKELANLKNLTTLALSETGVTDVGLKELANLKNLATLHLSLTRVTDAGLKELADMKNLTVLNVHRTDVTDAGVAQLQKRCRSVGSFVDRLITCGGRVLGTPRTRRTPSGIILCSMSRPRYGAPYALALLRP